MPAKLRQTPNLHSRAPARPPTPSSTTSVGQAPAVHRSQRATWIAYCFPESLPGLSNWAALGHQAESYPTRKGYFRFCILHNTILSQACQKITLHA